MNRIAIIIPARNEEQRLAACIASLTPFSNANDLLLVVDAQSTDATATLATETGATCIDSPYTQRGYCIAFGINHILQTAQPDVILIAHADMIFPPNARETLLQQLDQHPEHAGGCFGHTIDHPFWLFRYVERGNNRRAKRFGMSYGDQAQFVRTAWLQQTGGFPWMPRLEDLELTLRMRKQHLFLQTPVTVPARHWKNGIILTTARNWFTVATYILPRVVGLQQPRSARTVLPSVSADHDPAS